MSERKPEIEELEISGKVLGITRMINKSMAPLKIDLAELAKTITIMPEKFQEQQNLKCPACGNEYSYYTWQSANWICPSDTCNQEVNPPVALILVARGEISTEESFRAHITKRVTLIFPQEEPQKSLTEEIEALINTKFEPLEARQKLLASKLEITGEEKLEDVKSVSIQREETIKKSLEEIEKTQKILAAKLDVTGEEKLEDVKSLAEQTGKMIGDRDELVSQRIDSMIENVWNTSYIDDLPDKCFAFIESGGKKDEEGKTVPRDLRHLPFRNATGETDKARLANALARLPQSEVGNQPKETARKKLCAAVRSYNKEHEEGKMVSELCGIGGSTELKKCAETVHNLGLSAALEQMDWKHAKMIRLAVDKVDKQGETLTEYATTLEEIKNTIESHVTFNKKLEEETLKEINEKVTAIEEAIKPKEETEQLKVFEAMILKAAALSEDDDDKKKENEGKYFNGIEYVPIPEDLSTLERALLKCRFVKQLFQEVKKVAKQSERHTINMGEKPAKETGGQGQQGLTNRTEEDDDKTGKKFLSFENLKLRDFV